MKTLRVLALSTLAALSLLSVPSAEARPMRICPMIYKPVCAMTLSGQRRTFGNACQAPAAHAHILYNGRCRYRR